MAGELGCFLDSVDLSQYSEVFHREKIGDLNTLRELSERDLTTMGLPKGARHKIKHLLGGTQTGRGRPGAHAGPASENLLAKVQLHNVRVSVPAPSCPRRAGAVSPRGGARGGARGADPRHAPSEEPARGHFSRRDHGHDSGLESPRPTAMQRDGGLDAAQSEVVTLRKTVHEQQKKIDQAMGLVSKNMRAKKGASLGRFSERCTTRAAWGLCVQLTPCAAAADLPEHANEMFEARRRQTVTSNQLQEAHQAELANVNETVVALKQQLAEQTAKLQDRAAQQAAESSEALRQQQVCPSNSVRSLHLPAHCIEGITPGAV